MKQKLSFFFLALATLVASTPSTLHAQTTPTVIISEVAWAGSSLSTADEWLELTNMTDHTIDVSGWLVNGAASSTLTLPAASLIAAHSTYLIANYDNTTKSSSLAAHAQFITAAVSLSNDKLGITLLQNDRTLVDSAGDGGNPFKGGTGGTGGTALGRYRSMERRGSMLNGALKDSWADADTSLGFKAGSLDVGTPGTVNAFLQGEIDASQAPVVTSIVAPVAAPAVDSTLVAAPIVESTTLISPPSQGGDEGVVAPIIDSTPVYIDSVASSATGGVPNPTSITEEFIIPVSNTATQAQAGSRTPPVAEATVVNVIPVDLIIESTVIASEPQTELMCMDIAVSDITSKSVEPETAETEALSTETPAIDAVPTDMSMTSLVEATPNDTATSDHPLAPSSKEEGGSTLSPVETPTTTVEVLNNERLVTQTIVPQVETTASVSNISDVETVLATTESIVESVETVMITPIVEPVSTTTLTTMIATTSIQAVATGSLRVNELYPHPATGEAEWVEIINTSSTPIVTNGFSLVDASGAVTAFPNGSIAPGSFLVIENPKGKLNNDGDTVIIKDQNGNVIDAVMYNVDLGFVPVIDESLIRTGTHTLAITTTPTRNASNVSTQKVVVTHSTAATNSTEATSTASTLTSNADAEVAIVATNTAPAVASTTSTAQAGSGDPTHSLVATAPNPTFSASILPPLHPSTPPATISRDIHLSELYPNTGGKDATDEFIEIINDGNEIVSLDGYSITDASGTRFAFSKTDSIAPHTFLAVMRPQSHITLNNTGDTVTLFAPDGSTEDSQSYDQANASASLAKINGVWIATGIPTPNQQNRAAENDPSIHAVDSTGTIASATTVATATSVRTVSARVLTIADAKLAKDNTRVTVRGFATVLPNTFNSQTMYLQDETGGVQIYKNDCVYPALALGQEVTVTGIIGHINGEVRIKVSKTNAFDANSTVSTVTASTVSTNNQDASVGSLMTIAGMVINRSGNQAFVDVDGTKWTVDLPKGSPMNAATFAKGSKIQVIGILTKSQNGSHLKPRSDADVSVEKPSSDSTNNSSTVQAGSGDPTHSQNIAILLAILVSLAGAAFKFRPHLYTLIKSYGRKQTVALGA